MMDSVHEKRGFSRSKLTVIRYPEITILCSEWIYSVCHKIHYSSVHPNGKSKVLKQPEDYERCHTRDEKILQDVQHEIVTNDREAPDPAPTDGVEGLGVQMDAGVTITVKVPKGVYCALEAGAADGGEGNGVTNVAETAGEVCGLLFEILAA